MTAWDMGAFRPGIGYAIGALKLQGFVIAILTVIIGVAFKAAMGDPGRRESGGHIGDLLTAVGT